MADLGQIIRHHRMVETVLVQLPRFSSPFEGAIVNITNDGEYAKVNMSGTSGGYWDKVQDIEVLAVLTTPSEIKRGLGRRL